MSARQARTSSGEDSSHPPAPSHRNSPISAISTTQPSIEPSEVMSTRPTPTPHTSYTPTTQSPAQPYFKVPESPRTAPRSSSETATKAAKVAIPRLKRSLESGEVSGRSGGRHRVNHACEPCRHRKTKCSGERPICRHCEDFKIACFYADGKRDRVKKQFGSMTEKVADYEKLLRDLMLRASDDDVRMIKHTMEKMTIVEVDESVADTSAILSVDGELDGEESGAESEVSGDVGSTGALDRTEEDFTRESARLTGFMGKNSEITWLQRLKQENRYGGGTEDNENASVQSLHATRPPGDNKPNLAEADNGLSIHDSSYHLNDLAISTFEAVDPYEMPTAETAQILFGTYMERMHSTFPIVGRVNLKTQFQKYISGPSSRPPAKWLAIINMIFAISAKYSHLIQAEWQLDDRDHLIYFTRARLLAIDHETIFNHPDLQQIQIFGLMAFYLMSTSQINRAWTVAGLALRQAIALGLNVRNDSNKLADSLKEIRYRLWWALYSLEHRLCSMTGRVNCTHDDHCTTPLPIPVEEENFDTDEGRKLLGKAKQERDRAPVSNRHTPSNASTSETPPTDRSRSESKPEQSRSPSNPQVPQADLEWAKEVAPSGSLYFLHLVQISRLTQHVFQDLYNPNVVKASWSDIQKEISSQNSQLESWYRQLPTIFDFRRKQRDRDFYEYRLSLGFFYYGTKQMLHRPCLCRLDRKIPDQSAKSAQFNRQAAMTCVEAAQDSLRLIPDEPNAVGLIRVGPWYIILHWLVQAASVLMLEITFRAHHMPEEADTILESSKKAVRWLHALGEEDLAAARAWQLCNTMLREAVVKIGRDVDDLTNQPPQRPSPLPHNDTSMSEYNTSHNIPNSQFMNNSTPQEMYSNTMMSGYPTMPGFNSFINYDQYYPNNANMGCDNDLMTGRTQSGQNFAQGPSDAEIEFMNATYHDDPASQETARQHESDGNNTQFR